MRFSPQSAQTLQKELIIALEHRECIQADEDWFNENPPLWIKEMLFVSLFRGHLQGKCANSTCSTLISYDHLDEVHLRWDQDPSRCVLFCSKCGHLPFAGDVCFISISYPSPLKELLPLTKPQQRCIWCRFQLIFVLAIIMFLVLIV